MRLSLVRPAAILIVATHVVLSDTAWADKGVYRCTDTGATWTLSGAGAVTLNVQGRTSHMTEAPR